MSRGKPNYPVRGKTKYPEHREKTSKAAKNRSFWGFFKPIFPMKRWFH